MLRTHLFSEPTAGFMTLQQQEPQPAPPAVPVYVQQGPPSAVTKFDVNAASKAQASPSVVPRAAAASSSRTYCQMLQWATNSVPLLREIDEFVKSEQQQLLDILEFGPFYRDITNIVEDEANVGGSQNCRV